MNINKINSSTPYNVIIQETAYDIITVIALGILSFINLFSPHRAPQVEVPPTVKQKVTVDPQIKMQETIKTIWTDASNKEREKIESIWSAMLKGAKVKEWSEVAPNHYQLSLEREVHGRIKNVPATFVIPNKLDVVFSEKEDHHKIISFPNNKISAVQFFTLGAVAEIDTRYTNVVVTAQLPIGSKSVEFTTGEARNLWNSVIWS